MMVHEELTQSSPHAEATEQELVQRVQAGDATAFDALFRRCCGKVFQHATRLLGNAAEAEEVVQEVFLAVYEKAQTFRGDAAFTTWLFRLTANAALSKLRRRKRSKEVAMEEYLPQCRSDGHHVVRTVVVTELQECGCTLALLSVLTLCLVVHRCPPLSHCPSDTMA